MSQVRLEHTTARFRTPEPVRRFPPRARPGLAWVTFGMVAAACCRGDAVGTAEIRPAGRGTAGSDAGGPAFFRAAIVPGGSGAGAAGVPGDAYEGTGEFGVNDPGAVRGPTTFSVNSRAADGRGDRSFSVVGVPSGGTSRLAVGAYAVTVAGDARLRPEQVTVTYTRVVDGWMEAYVGQAGALTVTTSMTERVAGTFRFTGVRYYRRPMRGTGGEDGTVRGRPDSIPPEQPTVDVNGTFAAEPWRAGDLVPASR